MPEGILLAGAREQPLLLSNCFCSAALPLAFAFRKSKANHAHPLGTGGLAPPALPARRLQQHPAHLPIPTCCFMKLGVSLPLAGIRKRLLPALSILRARYVS